MGRSVVSECVHEQSVAMGNCTQSGDCEHGAWPQVVAV